MRKIVTGICFVVCAFATVGWGSSYSNKSDRDKGYQEADRTHQGDDEDIKRAQGDESGRKFIHDNKSHQDE